MSDMPAGPTYSLTPYEAELLAERLRALQASAERMQASIDRATKLLADLERLGDAAP